MDPNSTMVSNDSSLFIYWTTALTIYAVVGPSAMISNILIFTIVFSDQKLRERSAILIGVAGSNFLYGLAIGSAGVFRMAAKAIIGRRVSSWFCTQLIFPLFMPLACLTLSVMLCVVGIDRLLATVLPNWYYKHWTPRRSWMTVFFAYIIAVLPLGWGLAEAWQMPTLTRLYCRLSTVYGSNFLAFYFGSTVAGGSIAVLLTLIAYFSSMKRISKLSLLNGELGRLRRQMQLTRAMFIISSMDFVLVVIPTAISCYVNATKLLHPQTVQIVCNIVYCINATVAIVVHLVLNSKFREVAVKLFRFSKPNSVAPVGVKNNQKRQKGAAVVDGDRDK